MVSTIKVNVNKFNCSIHDLVGFTWNVNFLGDTYKWKIVDVNDFHVSGTDAYLQSAFWELFIEHDTLHDDFGVIKEVEKVILPFTGSKEV